MTSTEKCLISEANRIGRIDESQATALKSNYDWIPLLDLMSGYYSTSEMADLILDIYFALTDYMSQAGLSDSFENSESTLYLLRSLYRVFKDMETGDNGLTVNDLKTLGIVSEK